MRIRKHIGHAHELLVEIADQLRIAEQSHAASQRAETRLALKLACRAHKALKAHLQALRSHCK
ncbi:MAG: hypothetical protein WCA44_18070 [Acidobacteriaceae bacterium]